MPLKAEYREDVLELLRGMLDGLEDVQLGQMMGHPVFYHAPAGRKRKMFTCVSGPGVALKLPLPLIDGLLGEPGYEPFAPMGRPMKGWLVVYRASAAELCEAEDLIRQALDSIAAG